VTPDQCEAIMDESVLLSSEVPVNIGCNYNGPQVAKFLGV